MRSLATPPATATRPPVVVRSMPTQPATVTRPPVLARFLATQRASTIPPLAGRRSIPTQLGTATLPAAEKACWEYVKVNDLEKYRALARTISRLAVLKLVAFRGPPERQSSAYVQ